MKKKRRKRGSIIATLAILAGTALLLYAVVEFWPTAPSPLPATKVARPEPATEAIPTAKTVGEAQGEEITSDERRALQDILQRRRTPRQ